MLHAALLLALLTTSAPTARGSSAVGPQQDDPAFGHWRGVLECPGGEIPFGLEYEKIDGRLRVWLVNGPERRVIDRIERVDDLLIMHVDPYDSRIEARLSQDRKTLVGEWVRYRGGDEETRLPFRATAGRQPRFQSSTNRVDAKVLDALVGRWRVKFSEDASDSVGIFASAGGNRIEGTFLTTLGDYRYLAGVLDGRRLRLSVFDGAHAFLFTATLSENRALVGEFWSRDTWHETWIAAKDPDAALPDASRLTRWTDEVPLSALSFPDLEGVRRNLADDIFKGPARIIVLFGTWCPNCYDETEYLVELQRRYGRQGLRILGLAFEFGDDFERHARVVRDYREHHGVNYPILIAGTSDKAKASKAFPALDRVRAYPTTLFLDAKGNVTSVYTGFSGPATGRDHERLRDHFETTIEELLGR